MKKTVYIGNKAVGLKENIFIVAEAGVNHNGSLSMAKKLVDAAKYCGADVVKFQTFCAEDIATKSAPKAAYQKRSGSGRSQYEMLKKLELSKNHLQEVYRYCNKKNIIFLSTPFDHQSAYYLYKMGVCAFKIGSGDMNNVPLLREISRLGRPIILSTGMSTMKEVESAVDVMRSAGNNDLILMHCTSNYPVDPKDVNLSAMMTMKSRFDVPIGYSDHTIGMEIAIAAASMGASIIEKHITIDNKLKGPDHGMSLQPDQFKVMVTSIRNVSAANGNGVKAPQKAEIAIRDVVRKSVVASRDIASSEIIKHGMLTAKRPGTGLEPKAIEELIGKTAKRNIYKDELVKRNWFS